MPPLERAFDLETARARAEELFAESQIIPIITTKGDKAYSARCDLFDKSGQLLDFGYGKGDEASCIVGSLFEAAEHIFCQFNRCFKHNVIIQAANSFAATHNLRRTLPISLITDKQEGSLAFRQYKCLHDSNSTLYPIALSTPRYLDDALMRQHPETARFDYSVIERYATNSGVAIGNNLNEAIIHGLLETIERDTVSQFLVDVFLFRESRSLRLVRFESLPKTIQTLVENASLEIGQPIVMFEMQNEFEIPCFCSTLKNSSFTLEISGFGCSLSREHAVARSIHELVQCYHATTFYKPEAVEAHDRKVLENLSQHPFHLRCAKFNLTEQARQTGCTMIEFDDASRQNSQGDLNHYLKTIINLLAKRHRKAYYAEVNGFQNGICIAHVFIDGQDQFFGVMEGNLVLPNDLDARIKNFMDLTSER